GGQPRNFVAALSASTGLATSWDPDSNAQLFAVAVSGTGPTATIFVGGNCTTFNAGAVTRNGIAALDATSGVPTAFDPNADTNVGAIVISGSIAYVGGDFQAIGGATRHFVAALDTTTGLATAWDPNADASVAALALSGSTIYAGGLFASIGGQSRSRLAALDTSTGLATPWNPSANDTLRSLLLSGATLFV